MDTMGVSLVRYQRLLGSRTDALSKVKEIVETFGTSRSFFCLSRVADIFDLNCNDIRKCSDSFIE